LVSFFAAVACEAPTIFYFLLSDLSCFTISIIYSDGSGQSSAQCSRGTNGRIFLKSSTCLIGLIPGGCNASILKVAIAFSRYPLLSTPLFNND
jgi:hypothetical protein